MSNKHNKSQIFRSVIFCLFFAIISRSEASVQNSISSSAKTCREILTHGTANPEKLSTEIFDLSSELSMRILTNDNPESQAPLTSEFLEKIRELVRQIQNFPAKNGEDVKLQVRVDLPKDKLEKWIAGLEQSSQNPTQPSSLDALQTLLRELYPESSPIRPSGRPILKLNAKRNKDTPIRPKGRLGGSTNVVVPSESLGPANEFLSEAKSKIDGLEPAQLDTFVMAPDQWSNYFREADLSNPSSMGLNLGIVQYFMENLRVSDSSIPGGLLQSATSLQNVFKILGAPGGYWMRIDFANESYAVVFRWYKKRIHLIGVTSVEDFNNRFYTFLERLKQRLTVEMSNIQD